MLKTNTCYTYTVPLTYHTSYCIITLKFAPWMGIVTFSSKVHVNVMIFSVIKRLFTWFLFELCIIWAIQPVLPTLNLMYHVKYTYFGWKWIFTPVSHDSFFCELGWTNLCLRYCDWIHFCLSKSRYCPYLLLFRFFQYSVIFTITTCLVELCCTYIT